MSDEQQQAEPDDSEPTAERQAELRALYGSNLLAGRPPYAGASIRTRGELLWVLHERGWSSEPSGLSQLIDLRETDLSGVVFGDVSLSGANLTGAYLADAEMSGTDLRAARL